MRTFWHLICKFGEIAVPIFPSGTRCFFDNDAPPTGWVRDTTASLDDRLIRIVSGSRTPEGGSWTLTGLTLESHSHGYSDLPAHSHSLSVSSHEHFITGYWADGGVEMRAALKYLTPGISTYTATSSTNTVGVSIASAGIAPPLTTGLSADDVSSDGTWRPLYRDLILAEKS